MSYGAVLGSFLKCCSNFVFYIVINVHCNDFVQQYISINIQSIDVTGVDMIVVCIYLVKL